MMFSKAEAPQLREEFWTTFGKYMQPVASAAGEKTKWLNYKTGLKGIYLRASTAGNEATVGIEISGIDESRRSQFYQLFLQHKNKLTPNDGAHWLWEENAVAEDGRRRSLICQQLHSVSVLNRSHWPQLITFFKKNLIALDAFWTDIQPAFELLGDE